MSYVRIRNIISISRSGYYDFVHRAGRPEKDKELADLIAWQRKRCWGTYGYRRMWMWLKRQNIHKNPKTILRIMRKYNLLSEIRRHRKWQQMGQQAHKYKNLLNRKFHADRPNRKWVTDISYIHTKQGVLYLSMIRDLYDNCIVAYRKRDDDPKSYSFNCSHYRNNVKEKCTAHRIREVVLDQILLEELRRVTYAARSKEREFAEYINQKSSSENRKELTAKQREYDRLTKRKAELNALFKRLYEDNVLGRVTNEQFRMLSEGYTDEQKALNLRLPELEEEIRQLTESASNVDKFISLAKKYTRITELTPEILHTFISKIVIHERSERYKQHSEQQIDIYFTHIGIVGEA